MSASSLKKTCLVAMFAFGCSSVVQAQLDSSYSPFYGPEADMQFFDPVDLDLDGRAYDVQMGFFFEYHKVYWEISGERVELGDPNTTQRWFQQYPGVPVDPVTNQVIVPPVIPNSIKDGIPRGNWKLGDRYEFGFWGENNKGWLMSVLNGPDDIQNITYGLNGGRQGGSQDGLRLPIGDVFVAFRTDPGLLASFIDLNEGPPNGILPDSDAGNGILDGDGVADDLNQNGVNGPDGIDQGDGTFLPAPPDYDDLVILPISFGIVNLRNTTSLNGFEVMHGHRLDNSHFLVQKQNNFFEWHFGARLFQMDDNFIFEGLGVRGDEFGVDPFDFEPTDPADDDDDDDDDDDGADTDFDNADWSIGDTLVNQSITNNIVGPQISYKWTHRRGRWAFTSLGKFMLGVNFQDWRQSGYIGEDLTPSRHNNYLFIPPQSFSRSRSDVDLSPAGELRLNVDYRLTDNVQFQVGYNGTFVNNIRRAANHVDYVLNENGRVMGFSNVNHGEDLFANGVHFAVIVSQ